MAIRGKLIQISIGHNSVVSQKHNAQINNEMINNNNNFSSSMSCVEQDGHELRQLGY